MFVNIPRALFSICLLPAYAVDAPSSCLLGAALVLVIQLVNVHEVDAGGVHSSQLKHIS